MQLPFIQCNLHQCIWGVCSDDMFPDELQTTADQTESKVGLTLEVFVNNVTWATVSSQDDKLLISILSSKVNFSGEHTDH